MQSLTAAPRNRPRQVASSVFPDEETEAQRQGIIVADQANNWAELQQIQRWPSGPLPALSLTQPLTSAPGPIPDPGRAQAESQAEDRGVPAEPTLPAPDRLCLHCGGGRPDQGAEGRGDVSVGHSSGGAWEQRAVANGDRHQTLAHNPCPRTCPKYRRIHSQTRLGQGPHPEHPENISCTPCTCLHKCIQLHIQSLSAHILNVCTHTHVGGSSDTYLRT